MFPFRNVLFPDDSVNAQAALKYATAFAQHGHGQVVLFNAQDGKTELASKIAQAAIDQDIDLITVALRDRSRLTRAFGSSLAEDIIAESPCAVLAIRPPQKDFVDGLKRAATIEINEPNLAKVRIDTSQAGLTDDGHGHDLPPPPMSTSRPPSGSP